MPIYEYTCQGCQLDFELLVRGHEIPACPQCSGQSLVKRMSLTAAPASGKSTLPICGPQPSGGCGLPQCGAGGCQFEE